VKLVGDINSAVYCGGEGEEAVLKKKKKNDRKKGKKSIEKTKPAG